jgi:hypothetical protein
MNGWGMGFSFIFWLLVVAAIIAGVVWFVRSQPLAGSQRREKHSTGLRFLRSAMRAGKSAARNTYKRSATSRPSDRLRKRVGKLLKLQGCW